MASRLEWTGAAVLLSALLVSPAALAGELEKVNLGEHWYGPNLKLEDLKGHVVLFEAWGRN
jgi:hypothetical protein